MNNIIFAKMKRELWTYTLYMDFDNGSMDEDIKFVNSLDEGRAKARDMVERYENEGRTVRHARVSRADKFHGDENLQWYLVYFYDGCKWIEMDVPR